VSGKISSVLFVIGVGATLLASGGCSQQVSSDKITPATLQSMSGHPPTPVELKRSQDAEAKAVIAPVAQNKQ
jgi:hypothetical protein